MTGKKIVALIVVMGGLIASASAQFVDHVPDAMVPPVIKMPSGAFAVPGNEVGSAGLPFGVDYTFGGFEAIFDDGEGDDGTIGGINGFGILDLLSDVDGRIVLPGTTTQGFTDFLFVEAGFAEAGDLLLEVFDDGGTLLASDVNSAPVGIHGRQSMTIDRGGVFDIASFRVSTPGLDTFGVNYIDMRTPVPIPLPGAALLGVLGLAAVRAVKRHLA